MKQVSITINGRDYDIACEEGQEDHLRRLAGYVDRRVAELVTSVGQIGDTRLLVLASLLIADELHDAREVYARETNAHTRESEAARQLEHNFANALDSVSGRLERLATRIANA